MKPRHELIAQARRVDATLEGVRTYSDALKLAAAAHPRLRRHFAASQILRAARNPERAGWSGHMFYGRLIALDVVPVPIFGDWS